MLQYASAGKERKDRLDQVEMPATRSLLARISNRLIREVDRSSFLLIKSMSLVDARHHRRSFWT